MRSLAQYLSIGALALCAWSGAQAQSAFGLAAQPLNVANNIAPNVMFALSVEFPTAITPAYNWSSSTGSTSGPYSTSITYLGYFDSGKCYTYNTSYSGAAGAYSATNAVNRYFVPIVVAGGGGSGHDCLGLAWSGNFMNWVSMAGLDEFRYAMTGGNRIVDSTTNTVLQRSYQTNQGGNFGEKQLTGSALVKSATPLSTGSTWYFNSSGQNMQMNFGLSANKTANSVYVQVQVCNSTIGLESNCTAYTNSSGVTTYKPTGSVQNNSDSMRFGMFSYFNSNSIDNAVMRAKMKFTGQYAYDASGVQSANTLKEWDPTTGIFYTDPDSSDTTITRAVTATRSGVINYINQFGTGSTSSNYKTYDNVSKLYYEALAYLRKRTLDSAFYSGASTSNADNFPVISGYTEDPVQAYCQKNFIFVMGDTHTWCDKRLPGGSFTSSSGGVCDGNPVDDKNSLSNGDTVNVSTWTNNISSGLATTVTGAGGASYYMSGLAFWAHTNDIRTDLNSGSTNKTTVSTYIIDVQEAQDTGINSQYWYAAKYGGFDTSAGATTPSSAASPSASNWSAYDTIYDGSGSTDGSASAGHGVRPKTYLPAGNPLAMITAVNSAFSQISAATKGDAAVTSSSGDLNLTGSVYQYQSTFTSVSWIGDLIASQVTVVTSGASVSSVPVWQAKTKLNAGNPSATARVVLSYNDGVRSNYAGSLTESLTKSHQGIAFNSANTSDLSTAQLNALQTNISGVNDGLQTNRINYIRGSRADEPSGSGCTGGGGGAAAFRCRTSLLGDIVHSQPAVVGSPIDTDFALTDPSPTDVLFQAGYLNFAINNTSRTHVVYVGANDGMLHGFNAEPGDANLGKEVLAYVPGLVVRNLSKLTSSAYSHSYYVDASPRAASICLSSCDVAGSAVWKTYLTAGLGAGGQGIFALDVTTPAFSESTPASTVKWEFTDRDDPDMGYFLGKPVMARMNNGQWAAIFGNGYNNTTPDGSASTTGAAVLYIAFLNHANGTGWTAGTDYIKITAGSSGTVAIPNGLGTPVAIDNNLDGKVDYIYAADIYGSVWKFDVSSNNSAVWGVAFAGQPFFKARDGAGNVQQITGGLGVTFSVYGGLMVNFGTGRYLATSDANSLTTQTYYGVLDLNDGTNTRPPLPTDPTPPTLPTAPSYRISGTTNGLQQQSNIAAGWFLGSASNNTVDLNFVVNTAHNDCRGTPANATCIWVQSDCKVNFPSITPSLANNLTPGSDATNCPYSISNPPRQLGWFYDLPNVAERYVEDRPVVQGGLVSFVSLAPSGVACTGGLSGYDYIVDANTGARPSANVFDITGSGISNPAQQLVVGGKPLVVSGVALPAGSTVNTPARYSLPPSSSVPGSSGAPGTPGGVGGAGVGCAAAGSTFIPGWGCVGMTSGSIDRSADCAGQSCMGLFMPGQKNKLYWRQLFTQ